MKNYYTTRLFSDGKINEILASVSISRLGKHDKYSERANEKEICIIDFYYNSFFQSSPCFSHTLLNFHSLRAATVELSLSHIR